jgi:hypothetical protein
MKYRRFNFEATDSHVTVCRDNHEKGQPCEYEELSPYEVVDILNDMRSSLLKVESLLEKIELLKTEL